MTLLEKYRLVRDRSVALAEPLTVEDQLVQSMPDASPTKWHLAHTSWFFETFVLRPDAADYRVFDDRFGFLFNSYYEALGARVARAERGHLSRPSLADVHAYRRHVDEGMARCLGRGDGGQGARVLCEVGLHHEQQHQELILTDIKHALSGNPLRPAYSSTSAVAVTPSPGPWQLRTFDEGLAWIGHEGSGFAFDNEGPRHRCFLRAFAIADRPVTCGEYLDFMRDGGYERPELWLSDGWQHCRREGWCAPLYWEPRGEEWSIFTLAGLRPLEPHETLAHVSFYEADAFARWAGMRLPTEQEWEHAAAQDLPHPPRLAHRTDGRLVDVRVLHPGPARPSMFGDVWQWTQSPYAAYPGYHAAKGAIGEYNGKFMSNQMVLRGGSCFTPPGHVRATYRNFFPPATRWQSSGIRLARDA